MNEYVKRTPFLIKGFCNLNDSNFFRCDRIFFSGEYTKCSVTRNWIRCVVYNSLDEFLSSDHKPVYGIFQTPIQFDAVISELRRPLVGTEREWNERDSGGWIIADAFKPDDEELIDRTEIDQMDEESHHDLLEHQSTIGTRLNSSSSYPLLSLPEGKPVGKLLEGAGDRTLSTSLALDTVKLITSRIDPLFLSSTPTQLIPSYSTDDLRIGHPTSLLRLSKQKAHRDRTLSDSDRCPTVLDEHRLTHHNSQSSRAPHEVTHPGNSQSI